MKIETPILRRLGPVPFWRGTTKCLDELERIYRRAHDFAAEKLGIGGGSPLSQDGDSPRRAQSRFLV